jgi:hypothetical protein
MNNTKHLGLFSPGRCYELGLKVPAQRAGERPRGTPLAPVRKETGAKGDF